MSDKKRELVVPKGADKKEVTFAKIGLSPTINAASTIELIRGQHYGGLDIGCLSAELKKHTEALKAGDMSRAEGLLFNQAHSLDAIFNALCERSIVNMGEYMGAAETYMRLALRAQNQCQATLRTLAELKTPKNIAFVKQANIAHNQQVINGGAVQPEPDSPAQENKKQQNELLEEDHGQRLDSRAQATATSINPELETVGAVSRANE